MVMPKTSKGSEWRKWDLHVHTASSEEFAAYKGADSDTLLVSAWKKHEFAAVAITDHFVIDIQRIKNLKELAPDITIFPGVELRTDKGTTNIHPIIIFQDNIDLDILDAAFKTFRNEKAESKDDFDSICWNFNDIVEFAKKYDGLISLHAGKKSNGIEDIDNKSSLNCAVKRGYAERIHIFEVGRLQDIHEYRGKVFPSLSPDFKRPLIICSDNHDPREYNIKEYLWIKANPTFEGLKQILMHPYERVHVGILPPKLEKLNKNRPRYIKNISVKRVDAPNFSTQNWFDFELELNPGLITIIGNKGSGKSALSDILGHLCKCSTMNEASFLHIDRFRSKKGNISKDYTARLEWFDGESTEFSLDTVDYGTTIEDAQYLPQQYIEKLCNNLDDSFQNEINNVIFSYIDVSERGQAANLDELKRNISAPLELEINNLKSSLETCIDKLIRYEDMLAPDNKKGIEDNLKKRREDLERHNKGKPKEVQKPKTQQSADYQKQLVELEHKITEIEKNIEENRNNAKVLNDKIAHLSLIVQKIKTISVNIDEINSELANIAPTHHIDESTFKISYTTPISKIEDLCNIYEEERKKLLHILAPITIVDASNEPENKDTLFWQREKLYREKDTLISTVDVVEKEYQAHLADLKEWSAGSKTIIGAIDEENSIEFYANLLTYITTMLTINYNSEKKNFFDLITRVFENKKLIVDKLINLYSPVRGELETALGSIDEKIEFDIEVSLDEKPKDFAERILQCINRNVAGMFFKQSGIAEMQKIVEGTSFHDISSVIEFINVIYKDINSNHNVSAKKVKDKKRLYNLLASLDFLIINFVLKLGGRSLQELSPGERGIVLLVFYLSLNKKDVPLIIDQPEDNLDNQSVFDKLVKCISKAKEKRQVIIVTHNPNIAIACDAEQIIYSSIDKKERAITYESGAIEDAPIKNHVIDVLEGTMPAFNLRRMKYERDLPEDSNFTNSLEARRAKIQ